MLPKYCFSIIFSRFKGFFFILYALLSFARLSSSLPLHIYGIFPSFLLTFLFVCCSQFRMASLYLPFFLFVVKRFFLFYFFEMYECLCVCVANVSLCSMISLGDDRCQALCEFLRLANFSPRISCREKNN